ncbi:response regulator [Teredinibacter purpureus]|uniref:hypothetical protein n=1 Tax=Teredinibacter purpureus TaxID=2731756 RepID=UPI001F32462F|nr:hypothetical protein [Teredinibacter purpureus]
MLTSAETKLVVATLTKRRAWLRKSLDDANLDPSARQDYMDSIKIIESAIKKLAASAPPPANKPAKPTAPPAPPPRKKLTMASARVLIAEDNADSANLLLDVLQDFGMTQADLATDGMEAFDKIKRAKNTLRPDSL